MHAQPTALLPDNFPKIDAPFVRENDDQNRYLATPEIQNGYEWVFEDGSRAVEKLDGTCAAIRIENDAVQNAYTRLGSRELQEVNPFGNRGHHYITRGVQNAIDRDYLTHLNDGLHFGELVGPAFGSIKNPHQLDEHRFIPFQWSQRKLEYRSWKEYDQTYDSIRNWFDGGIFSLFHCLQHNSSDTVAREEGFCEGVIIMKPSFSFDEPLKTESRTYTTEDGGTETIEVATELAKLRVDMFPEFYTR